MASGRVLVTGSAGLLGGEICGRLTDKGYEVIGLVNRNPDILRNDGRTVPVLRAVQGDITKESFGLSEAEWQALAEEADTIVHCAAVTDFVDENDLHRAVNVEGTKNVLALTKLAGAKLVHISTAYIAGDREGTLLETEFDEGQGFTNGYESTKLRAERLVRDSDVRFAIARPGIVLGDHQEGRTRSFDTIYPILKVFAEGWVRTMPAAPHATLDLVPIDHVCRGIIAMVERFDEAEGKVFHLVSGRPTPLRAFPETLAKFEGLSSPDWVDPESFDMASLRPSERRFFQRGAEVYARYFTRNPQYDDSQYRAFSGEACPPCDEAWWERITAYCIEAGFIKPRKKRGAA
ncbi:SDR family oxidoreductase [Parvularcula sp. ZS-1/3]|uniref:SDR family oxidoreductase n=1 Tax=Parvularcula mediterranea TaxID=2732508 RepID=A0A7Y3W403_9PROT|nr:SDR family oxidoreductase [Parvularcula mediterranea]NNU14752.1 SDR family oxidoreductase [Parvularcula mediterranea]